MTINLGMLDEPIRWDIHLSRTDESRRLDLAGEFSRAEIDSQGEHDVELALKAAAVALDSDQPPDRIARRTDRIRPGRATAGPHLGRR